MRKTGGTLYGDVDINILGGKIKGSVYGGGKGSSKYGTDRPNLAQIYGNIDIDISQNADITGSVYGGSEGIAEYPNIGKVTGNILMDINGENVKVANGNNIYGSGNAGSVDGTIKIDITGITTSANIFGGGYGKTAIVEDTSKTEESSEENAKTTFADVNGVTKIFIKRSKITGSVYGGGNAGDVYGNTIVSITEGTNIENSVYGGGNAANIGKENETSRNTYLYVSNANIGKVSGSNVTGGEVFGGGNQGIVYGNTYMQVGNEEDEDIKTIVGNQIYAGGKGADSSKTTVTGSATSRIAGINTNVKQYGSSDLGKVEGKVNIYFDEYKKKNNTNRYKLMSGINKATNIYLNNSYVYLTGGLANIENLNMPKSSGMMISEDSALEGNFTGGGELYLQNKVTLTIKGDITKDSKTTRLTLNPQIQEEKGYYEIAGGKENPYIVVLGTDNSANKTDDSGNELQEKNGMISGNTKKYTIKNDPVAEYSGNSNASIYYIENSIIIPGYANERIFNKEGRIFNTDITNEDEVFILDNESFSSKINIEYTMIRKMDEATEEWTFMNNDDMKNLRRYIYLTGQDEASKLPEGTIITMITGDGEYYTYKIQKDFGTTEFWKQISADSKYLDLGDSTTENLGNEIPLCLFKNSDGNSYFTETKNIQELIGKDDSTDNTICSLAEDYRFVIDFSDCKNLTEEEKQSLQGEHELVFDIWDYKKDSKNNIIQEETFTAKKYSNEIEIDSRDYQITVNNGNEVTSNNNQVDMNIRLTTKEISEFNKNDYGKNVIYKMTLLNNQNQVIKIPKGMQISIDGTQYDLQDNEIDYKIIESLKQQSYDKKIDLQIDMSNVSNSDIEANGEYYLKIDMFLADGDTQISNVPILTKIQNFVVKKDEGYGIKVTPIVKSNDRKDQSQLILGKEDVSKKVNIKVQKGSLDGNVYVKVKSLAKSKSFEYNETEETIVLNQKIDVKDNGNYESTLIFDRFMENRNI